MHEKVLDGLHICVRARDLLLQSAPPLCGLGMPAKAFAVLCHSVLNALVKDGENLRCCGHVVPAQGISVFDQRGKLYTTNFFFASKVSESELNFSRLGSDLSDRTEDDDDDLERAS